MESTVVVFLVEEATTVCVSVADDSGADDAGWPGKDTLIVPAGDVGPAGEAVGQYDGGVNSGRVVKDMVMFALVVMVIVVGFGTIEYTVTSSVGPSSRHVVLWRVLLGLVVGCCQLEVLYLE